MEKIYTDYKQPNLKNYAKLFNICKPWRNSFHNTDPAVWHQTKSLTFP